MSIEDGSVPPANHLSRREWMRVGRPTTFGLSLPQVLRANEAPAPPRLAGERGARFGKAKNAIGLWLQRDGEYRPNSAGAALTALKGHAV